MWQFAAKKFPDVNALQDLNDSQYAECLDAVHKHLMMNEANISTYVREGKGVQQVSGRSKGQLGKAKFGSEAEQYNGKDGGCFFKWYSQEIFQQCLRQIGVTEDACNERQCMEALAAYLFSISLKHRSIPAFLLGLEQGLGSFIQELLRCFRGFIAHCPHPQTDRQTDRIMDL